MYSSEQLEKFYFIYQSDALSCGMSLQTLSSRNNVPYKVIEKWFGDTQERITPVEIIEMPMLEAPQPSSVRISGVPSRSAPSTQHLSSVRLDLTVTTDGGLTVIQKILDRDPQNGDKFIAMSRDHRICEENTK